VRRRGAGEPAPQPTDPPAVIPFLRDEVVNLCAAVALGISLLRRLDLAEEATRLEALYRVIEERLTAGAPASGANGA
jgi:hypothetical protein